MENFKFKNEKKYFESKYEGIAQLLAVEEFIVKLEKMYGKDSMGFENFIYLLGADVDLLKPNIQKYKNRIRFLIDDYFPF